jgi:cob(I)alamin adenosyltransferase
VKIYTKKGDDGTTGLLYGGRVPKDDIRTDVYGTIDETVSALGIARAGGLVERVEAIVVRLQREMFVCGAHLATAEANQSKLQPGVSRVMPEMTAQVEHEIDELTTEHPLPQEFILPGATSGSAGLDLARSTIRRAERRTVTMESQGFLPDPEILRWLNRVSDLLFVLARYQEAASGVRAEPSRERE